MVLKNDVTQKTGSMHNVSQHRHIEPWPRSTPKFGEVWPCGFRVIVRVDKHTDGHAHRNTSHPSRRRSPRRHRARYSLVPGHVPSAARGSGPFNRITSPRWINTTCIALMVQLLSLSLCLSRRHDAHAASFFAPIVFDRCKNPLSARNRNRCYRRRKTVKTAVIGCTF